MGFNYRIASLIVSFWSFIFNIVCIILSPMFNANEVYKCCKEKKSVVECVLSNARVGEDVLGFVCKGKK
jgi:hypothetical protein